MEGCSNRGEWGRADLGYAGGERPEGAVDLGCADEGGCYWSGLHAGGGGGFAALGLRLGLGLEVGKKEAMCARPLLRFYI